jgi:hypothetical protein
MYLTNNGLKLKLNKNTALSIKNINDHYVMKLIFIQSRRHFYSTKSVIIVATYFL